ncbi:GNAT family N-acetyltransferase [Nonomuraea sp. NPDC000554]|uniref:GNAT family N-acetyltransferase n=1 Tax=Nonomuraea sp. NPDC000554 TaxID=3154259 RepID=UPI00332C8423
MITEATPLKDGILLRPVVEGDAEAVLAAYERNREHLLPWEPRRAPEFFTLAGQRARIREMVETQRQGQLVPWILVDGDRMIGTMTLSGIVMGPFRNANLGYWVDGEYNGRGIASLAVQTVLHVADEQLGLHRIQAGTLVHNVGSQRVLAKAGFELIGRAPRYLAINGVWQDHLLFQRILHDRPPTAP